MPRVPRQVGKTDLMANLREKIGSRDRDPLGLPLGDVHGHALKRLNTSYAIIEAARLGAEVGQVGHGRGIAPPFAFSPVGARVQDHGSGLGKEYVAAHVAPCTLAVGLPGTLPDDQPALYQIFRHPITTNYTTKLFEQTDIVHRLTNYVDERYEQRTAGSPGMSRILAESSNLAILNPRSDPREIYYDVFLPGFKRHAQHVMQRNESALTVLENQLMEDPPENPHATRSETGILVVDKHGRPKNMEPRRPRAPGAGLIVWTGAWSSEAAESGERGLPIDFDPWRTNTRVGNRVSPEEAWINRHAVHQINLTYLTAAPPSADIEAIHEQFDALRKNEK